MCKIKKKNYLRQVIVEKLYYFCQGVYSIYLKIYLIILEKNKNKDVENVYRIIYEGVEKY